MYRSGGRSVCGSNLKAHRAETVPVHADALLRHPFTYKPGGDGCEEDAAAKMSGGDQQALDVGRSENGEMIR